MTGDFHHVPGTQRRENFLGKFVALVLELGDFLTDINVIIVADELQLFNLGFQLSDWLFKVEGSSDSLLCFIRSVDVLPT